MLNKYNTLLLDQCVQIPFLTKLKMSKKKQSQIKAIWRLFNNLCINRKHLIIADDSQFLANTCAILSKHFLHKILLDCFEGRGQGGGKGYLLSDSHFSFFSQY